MSFGRRPNSSNSSSRPTGVLGQAVQSTAVVTLLGGAVCAVFFALRSPSPTANPQSPAPEETAASSAGPYQPDISRLRRFPNVTVTYYDVPGTDPKAITDYMRKHGPVDSNDGFRAQGMTTWRVNWYFPSSSGACNTSRARIVFSGDVLLPRLTEAEKLSPRVRAAWGKMMARLISHEEGHLQISYGQLDTITTAVRRSTCESARVAADAAIARINAKNTEYDRETQHGLVDSDKFPSL
jgi:predicted secreted Zn-dependent protease